MSARRLSRGRDARPSPGSRGSVLVQVLIMSLLMAILATGLIRMVMNQYVVAVDAQRNTVTRQGVEAVAAAVQSAWATNGSTCSDQAPNIICGNPNTCACACTVRGYSPSTYVVQVTGPPGGPCAIRVTGVY